MNRELTPLEALRIIREHDFPLMITTNPPIPSTMNGKTEKELWSIIETALKENQERIEELEETNHLMFIREHKNEKKLKVLEIIKEKKVDVDLFYTVIEDKIQKDKLWAYNFWQSNKNNLLTQEEYDLLEEVLL